MDKDIIINLLTSFILGFSLIRIFTKDFGYSLVFICCLIIIIIRFIQIEEE